MNRRDLLAGMAAATFPLPAMSQQRGQLRVGVLSSIAPNDPEASIRATIFDAAMRELGWALGRDVLVTYAWINGGPEELQSAAADLLKSKPDVVVGHATPATRALLATSSAVPIIFVNVVDPVGPGFVETLKRPGGQVTGFTNYETTMTGKWIQILREFSPNLSRLGVIFNPKTTTYLPLMWEPIEAATKSLRLEAVPMPFTQPDQITAAQEEFAREPNGGLLVIPDVSTQLQRKPIIAAATKFRLPAVYPYRFFVTDGGLVSYGVDNRDQYRRVATYVDRVLKGEKPSELPVQQPVKFELAINLSGARIIGAAVPPILLATSDHVIE